MTREATELNEPNATTPEHDGASQYEMAKTAADTNEPNTTAPEHDGAA